MGPVTVERSDDPEALARVLAAGFAHDPVMAWVFPAVGDRAVALRPWYRLAAEAAAARRTAWLLGVDAEPGGAALWNPPGEDDVFAEGSRGEVVQVASDLGGEGSLARLGALAALMEEHHPRHEAHWYLFLAAVDPAHQGRGLGERLLRPVLRRADATGVGCYLEATSARSVPFYERQGFLVTAEVCPDGGPVLRGMWRPARPAPPGPAAPGEG